MKIFVEVSICNIEDLQAERTYCAVSTISHPPLFLVNTYGKPRWNKKPSKAAIFLDEDSARQFAQKRFTVTN